MRLFVKMGIALMLGLVASVATNTLFTPKPEVVNARAQWAEVYKTPGGLVAGADLVVVAELNFAEPGEMLGSGASATPLTNNYFSVVHVLKGRHLSDELLVEQTGGEMEDGVIMNIDDGGPYRVGGTYLLFLKNQGNGVHYAINHQSRYEMDEDTGLMMGVDPTDAVVARFHNKPIDVVLNRLDRRIEILK